MYVTMLMDIFNCLCLFVFSIFHLNGFYFFFCFVLINNKQIQPPNDIGWYLNISKSWFWSNDVLDSVESACTVRWATIKWDNSIQELCSDKHNNQPLTTFTHSLARSLIHKTYIVIAKSSNFEPYMQVK